MVFGLPDAPQWVLAVGLSLVGTTCSTFGLNVQKLGHTAHAQAVAEAIADADAAAEAAERAARRAAAKRFRRPAKGAKASAAVGDGYASERLTKDTGDDTDVELGLSAPGPDAPLVTRAPGTSEAAIAQASEAAVGSVFLSPLWLFGFAVFVLGECLSGVAMSLGSQTLLAVLSTSALLSNALFAALLHGERVSRSYMTAAGAIIAGAVLVVAAAPHGPQDYDLAQLRVLFKSTLFHVFASIVLVALAAALCLRSLLPKSAYLAALVAALVASFSVLFAKCSAQLVKASLLRASEATIAVSTKAGEAVVGVVSGAASAVAGVASNATVSSPADMDHGGKAAGRTSVMMGDDGEMLDIFRPQAMLIFGTFIACAATTMFFLNQALRRGRAVSVYPFYFSVSTLVTLCAGLVFFEEYRALTPLRGAVFGAGVVLVLGGMKQTAGKEPTVTDPPVEVVLEEDVSDSDHGHGHGHGQGRVGLWSFLPRRSPTSLTVTTSAPADSVGPASGSSYGALGAAGAGPQSSSLGGLGNRPPASAAGPASSLDILPPAPAPAPAPASSAAPAASAPVGAGEGKKKAGTRAGLKQAKARGYIREID